MKNRLISFRMGSIVVALTIWLFNACSDEYPNNAHVDVRLTDAPGDFQQVNIDIQSVLVHASKDTTSADSTSSAWRPLDMEPGIYDLLTLTNGLDTLLGGIDLSAGHISQIRLVLGENNSVMVDSATYPLKVPSGQQSGLKINVHKKIEAGSTYTVKLDFDAAKSVSQKNDSLYMLKPVIKVVKE